MDSNWRLSTPSGPVVIALASATGAEARERALSAHLVTGLIGRLGVGSGDDVFLRNRLGDLFVALHARPASGLATEALRRAVIEALHSGRLVALREGPVDRAPAAVARAVEVKEVDEAVVTTPEHTLDFVFAYPDGTPVKGPKYTLVDPVGASSDGTLGDDGTIHKSGVRPGVYTVSLKEVERVAWEHDRIKCDDEVQVFARTCGYPTGTAGKLRVYREFVEQEADALDTVDVAVENDAVTASWKYDYTKSDESKKQQGTLPLVAEISFDGGKRWAKTLTPVRVELKSIAEVRWQEPIVASGSSARLHVRTLGYPDGVQAQGELWAHDPLGDDTKIKALDPVALAAGEALFEISYDDSAQGGPAIEAAGEYYVKVKLEDNVTRTARSRIVWCRHSVAGAA